MRRLWKATCSAAVTLAVAMTGMRGDGQTLEEITSNFPLTIADGARSYIYGSPLMLMGVTSRTGTNVPNATTKLGAAPLNQLGKELVLGCGGGVHDCTP